MRLETLRKISVFSARRLLACGGSRLRACAAALALSLAAPLSAGWIHDESGRPPRLEIEQAIWAMTGLPRGGPEWSREEKVAKIAEAGFDGFMLFLPRDRAEQDAYAALARKHGLKLTIQCAPSTLADLEEAIEAAKRMKARAIVGLIRPIHVTYDEGRAKIVSMTEACERAGIPFYVETHRGTITQDLFLTARWARDIPGIQMHGDLSHYAISYEIGGPPGRHVKEALEAIIPRLGMLDGRVGNGEQVQIDVGPKADTPQARLFAGWWRSAMEHWLRNAQPGDIFVFKPELGPPPYSIVDLEGRELSDRWEQALVLRDLAIRLWNEAVEKTGKGERYELRKKAPRVAAGDRPAAPETPEPAPKGGTKLKEEPSGIFVLRGECVRIGDFYLSAQLGQPAFELARDKGIKTIVNVRMPRELGGLGFDIAQTCKELGLEYVHIPVAPSNMDDARAELFIETLRKAKKPVLINGSNGNRVWGLWALYAGVEYGIPVDETKRMAAEWGVTKLVIEDFVRDYLKRKGKAGAGKAE